MLGIIYSMICMKEGRVVGNDTKDIFKKTMGIFREYTLGVKSKKW